MIADFPGHALAFLGVPELGEPVILFLNTLVYKEMTVAFTMVAGQNQFLGEPQARDDDSPSVADSMHTLDALHSHLHILPCAIPIGPTASMSQTMDTQDSTAWP
jgi:hypothetical protein